MVLANAEFQPILRENLRPIHQLLLPHLDQIFRDPTSSDSQRLGAANAFADYAARDFHKLSDLLTIATPEQFAILYPIIAAEIMPTTLDFLGQVVAEPPSPDLGSEARVPFGQRRANAAVTLLRLGVHEKILPVFHTSDDVEALLQFPFRCRPRGVGVEHLLNFLQRVSDAPPSDQSRNGRYALLMALGEFTIEEIPASRRKAVLQQLADWYRHDPSSSVHGAAGWLLRHWGEVEIARAVDQTAVPYAPGREWFTLGITVTPAALLSPPADKSENSKESSQPAQSNGDVEPQPSHQPPEQPPKKTFYFTFIVFPAGEYKIGSPADEPSRSKFENSHPVKLTRPFAILDREVALEELLAYSPKFSAYMKQFKSNPEFAGFGAEWYDAVGFCRWLGRESGLSEGDQPYTDPESLDKTQYPREPNPDANWAPRYWPLELSRPGFRLPTESEWEVAQRAGARNTYSFGSDVSLLGRFGWFAGSDSKDFHRPRELRPSIRGLFDMHGNMLEWTHDWFTFADYGPEVLIDPLGANEGSYRVNRGGGVFDVAATCRSASRLANEPTYVAISLGFRIALTLPDSPPAR